MRDSCCLRSSYTLKEKISLSFIGLKLSPIPRYNRPEFGCASLSARLSIDVNQKVVTVTFAGEITDTDLAEIGALTRSHPLFDPSFSEIVDFSTVTGGNISKFALQTLAQGTSVYDRASKHVVVAPQPQVFGLTRMFQVYAEETRPNLVVVHTLEQARKSLGIQKNSD